MNWNKSEIREKYWNHLFEIFFQNYKKSLMPIGFTKKRIEKVKKYVMIDNDFWWDVIDRHGDYDNPNKLKEKNIKQYEHSMGNMYSMIYQIMFDKNIIKR